MRFGKSISAPRLAALITALLAAVALVGWWFHMDLLTSKAHGLVTMKANTAIALIFLAGSLYCATMPRLARPQFFLALLAAITGSLTLLEYAFRANFGIDELLARDVVRSTYPGRMAPITAANFVLLGLALLPVKFKWADYLREALAFLVALGSTFAIVGYLYGVPVLYGASIYNSTAMALHTGIASLLVAIGFLLIRREQGFVRVFHGASIGSMVARYLVPAAVLVPFALGAVFIRSHLHQGHLELAMALSVVATMVLLGLLIWTFALIVEHVEKARATAQMHAETDALTGIYNRRHFDSKLGHEVERAKRYSTPLALIIFDVDHFKDFNDRHGHRTGDLVLQAIARECQRNLRDADCFCRYGGEEFAIIAPETSTEAAMLLARRVREAIGRLPVDGIPEPITISSGVAALDNSINNAEQLCVATDQALYEAKNSGRNRECCYAAKQPQPSLKV